MQCDRALHIVKEIHVGRFDILGCLDEYLYLLTGCVAALVPWMGPQPNANAHVPQLALIPMSILLWSSWYETDNDFHAIMRERVTASYTHVEISIGQTQ